jgi:multiple sugar transport system permease protein
MFAMMSALRLTDSLHGLIIAYLGSTCRSARGYSWGISVRAVELEEAARVDGCNRVTALLRVVLPMSLRRWS